MKHQGEIVADRIDLIIGLLKDCKRSVIEMSSSEPDYTVPAGVEVALADAYQTSVNNATSPEYNGQLIELRFGSMAIAIRVHPTGEGGEQ